MKYTLVTAVDVLTGLETNILYPIIEGKETPKRIEILADYSMMALSTLLRDEEIEWVKVARFDTAESGSQFLVLTDKEEETLSMLSVSGREIRHGDIYEASISSAVTHADVDDEALIHGEVEEPVQDGIDKPVTREDLEREDLSDFIAQIQEALKARENIPESTPESDDDDDA